MNTPRPTSKTPSTSAYWLCLATIAGMGMTELSGAEAAPLQPISSATYLMPDGVSAGGPSFSPSFTADSKHLLFVSAANNLVTNDDRAPWMDIFLHDLGSARTILVSANVTGVGGGDGNSWTPSASADGRYVAFVSNAENLTRDPIPFHTTQIYVRDTELGTTRLISRSPLGTGGNGASQAPKISENGRLVVFESEASDLTQADNNSAKDIFAYDLERNQTILVSVREDGTASGNGTSDSARISADGSSIVFRSEARDLTAPAQGGFAKTEIYLRSIDAGKTMLISEPAINDGSATAPVRSTAIDPEISSDGRFVAYKTISPRNYAVAAILRDLQGTNHFWIHRWGPASALFTSSPLFIRQPEPTLVCEVSYLFSFLKQQDYLTLKLTTTADAECTNSGFGLPASQLTDSYPPPAQPGFEFGCFHVEALAEIQGNRIQKNGVRPSVSTDGSKIAVCDLLLQSISKVFSFFTVEERTPPVGVDGSEALEGSVIYDLASGTRHTAPLFASPMSQTISPDGQWLAFDSPIPDRNSDDRNSSSDVFVVRVGERLPRLITKRLTELPAHLGWPTPRLPSQSTDASGTRLALTGHWPRIIDARPGPVYWDLFLHDQLSERTTPISPYSVPTNSQPIVPSTPTARSNIILRATIGYSGRYLTVNSQTDVPRFAFPEYFASLLWSYDLELGTRQLIAEGSLDQGSLGTEIRFSTDSEGQRVVFESARPQLVATDSDTSTDIFLFDRRDPQLRTRISEPRVLEQAQLRGHSTHPLLSPNGEWVLFESTAADLGDQPLPAGVHRLWLYNVQSKQTFEIREPSSTAANDVAEWTWSADSSTLAIRTTNSICFSVDIGSRSSSSLPSSLKNLQLSSTGRFLAAQSIPEDHSQPTQITRMDLVTRNTVLVSAAPDGSTPGNGPSLHPQISPDGRWVYFSSEASNLVPIDDNHRPDVFARDCHSNTTFLLSRSALAGKPGNGASSRPLLSANGNVLFFQSTASDLITNDFDGREGLFQIRFEPVDSDQDGLPDEWEKRYFSDLGVANATTDSDGDGILDAAELGLGLNPANSGSQAKISPSSFGLAEGFRFSWTTGPWGGYVVQYADSLLSPGWRNLGNPLPMFQTSGTGVDTNAVTSSARYYRIQRGP